MHEDAAAPVSAEAQPAQAAAAAVAPDVAEAAAAAAFELPVHAIQPLPVAPAAAPAERQERASGDGADDDGFEFGSDAASDSSSSWTSSDEETGAPISSAALPAWLARRTAGGRCACGGGSPCLAAAHRASSLRSDVDDDEDEAPARVPPAAEPEVRRLLAPGETHASCQLNSRSQAPALVLLPVEPTDEIRLAGTILSVVGAMIVVQVRACRSFPWYAARCSHTVVQAAKDEALLDDGSTICFENRTPLGQASCACRCTGSAAVCVCASTLTGTYGRRWTKPLGPCRRRCMLCAGVRSGTRQQRCAVSARMLRLRLLTPAPQPPAIGERVFFVVNRSNFIEDVAKLHVKGYDASGKDDAEVEEEEEFSDDEKARRPFQSRDDTMLTARAYRRKRRLDSKGSRSASRGLKVPWTR